MRVCPKCKEAKKAEHFNKHKKQCKECRAAVQREYVARNREAISARNKEWRKANPRHKGLVISHTVVGDVNAVDRNVRLSWERVGPNVPLNAEDRRVAMRDIWVDFNDVDNSGRASTLARFAQESLHLFVGRHVVAGDDDGNVCDATIVDMSGRGLVTLALDLGTFRQESDRVAT